MAIFLSVCVSALVTVLWTALDRKRLAYPKLQEWMGVMIRAYLIAGWFSFGLTKIIPNQTPFPHLQGLMRPFGSAAGSASGIAWMIGFSAMYATFTGLAEFASGFFLCFRRTVTLGALLTAGTIIHVLAYVAGGMVWMQASAFLFPALVLAAPDAKRLMNIFIYRRPTLPRSRVELFRSPALNVAARVVGTAYVVYVFLIPLADNVTTRRIRDSLPPLWGIYDVREFSRGGQAVPPLLTDSTRWRNLTIGPYWGPIEAQVRAMTDKKQTFAYTIDTVAKTLVLSSLGAIRPGIGTVAPGNETFARFTYTSPDTETLVLSGTLGPDSVQMKLQRVDELKFPLVRDSWRWDWIPYNERFPK
jgi:hypothetical protein